MPTINRYVKDTIRGQRWEINIVENKDGTYRMDKCHVRKNAVRKDDSAAFIEENSKDITKAQAEAYMEKNKEYFIERYKEPDNE